MGSLMSETLAVVLMNIRSLPQRIWMSLATLLAVAIVVAVLLAFLSMVTGFQKTVQNTGSDDFAVIMRAGAQSEINSVLLREQINLIELAPGIERDAQGPVVSGELYVIVDAKKRDTGSKVNLPLRGISSRGIEVRQGFELVKGRMFEPGKNELVIGRSALQEFTGFEMGKPVKLGKTEWIVVGVFAAGGSVFGSEIWADLKTVQSQFHRGSSVQIMRVKLQQSGDLSPIKEYADKEPQLNLDIKTERQYYVDQSQSMKALIYMGWGLSIAMALGALAGALNTMYTSVAQRATEIATLRAIGFSGVSAFFGTLVESLVLAVIGGLIGALAAMLFFDGLTASTLGGNFTQIVFDFSITLDSVWSAVKLALFIGLIGGFFPALRAARLPVQLAFRI